MRNPFSVFSKLNYTLGIIPLYVYVYLYVHTLYLYVFLFLSKNIFNILYQLILFASGAHNTTFKLLRAWKISYNTKISIVLLGGLMLNGNIFSTFDLSYYCGVDRVMNRDLGGVKNFRYLSDAIYTCLHVICVLATINYRFMYFI